MGARPPFPAAIDNTMRSSFTECERKFWLQYLRCLASPNPPLHLIAGGAFAKGMEVARKSFYEQRLSPQESVELGWVALVEEFATYDDEHWKNKTCFNVSRAFVDYFREYPLESDDIVPVVFNGKPAIEFNFGIPLPINHPETGLPIIYCGRFDMLGQRNSQLFVVDEKTTGSLGEYWANRYQLSSQFTGYSWAAREHGYSVVGAVIRGIGILTREIKHAQLILPRMDFMIDEWYRTLLEDVQKMVLSWVHTAEDISNQWSPHIWKPELGAACGDFGGCQFSPVCGIAPEMRDRLLEVNFTVRPWDPMRIGEE